MERGLRGLAVVVVAANAIVFAATAGSRDSVVAALAHRHTSFSWEVAQQAREEQGEEGDGGPADAAARLRAREGLVRARVFVVAGAVVEKPLDAADARPVFHRAVRRAHAPAAARPAGREQPRANALRTRTPTAVLALVGVYAFKFQSCAARHRYQHPGLAVQGFQLL